VHGWTSTMDQFPLFIVVKPGILFPFPFPTPVEFHVRFLPSIYKTSFRPSLSLQSSSFTFHLNGCRASTRPRRGSLGVRCISRSLSQVRRTRSRAFCVDTCRSCNGTSKMNSSSSLLLALRCRWRSLRKTKLRYRSRRGSGARRNNGTRRWHRNESRSFDCKDQHRNCAEHR
jgi:hypothetical protein